MIRIQVEGKERELSYEEFIRAIRDGVVTAETPVSSDALTSGTWRPAAELRFFRVWAPKGSLAEGESSETIERIDRKTPTVGPSTAPVPPSEKEVERAEPPSTEWEESRSEPPETDPPLPPETVPFEQIDRLGFPTGLYVTIWLAMKQPTEFFRRVSAGEAFIPATAFGLLLFAVAAMLDGAYGALTVAWFGDALESVTSQFPGLVDNQGIGTPRDIFFSHGLRALFYPAAIALWSGLVHLFIRSFSRPEKGFIGTFRVVNYSMAPLILSIVPVCGNVIGWIWVIALMVFGVNRVQRAPVVLSILAVVVPIVVFFCFFSASLLGPVMQSVPGLGNAV